MTKPALLRCSGLVKVHRAGGTEVVALQGLDLGVAAGEMVGVVGASGSGKSTLLKVISATMQPTAGRVSFGGEDLTALSARQLDRFRRDELGFVWQERASNLLGHLTALQNVMEPLALDGRPDARSEAATMLERVGLSDKLHRRPHELSGGEAQRVAIATALVHAPRLLLADEPTGELDTATTAEVFAVLRQLRDDLGTAQLIVSHDPALASHVDRVVSIRDGRLAAEQRGDDGGGREVLVVDNVGRLQLPEDALLATGIGDRVTAEVTANGVLLRPIEPDADGEDSP